MAKSIIKEFPNLDNNNGDGYCAWYTPGSGTHDASGFIENRLRNVRSRDPSKTRSSVAKSQGTSSSTRLISTVNIDRSTDELSEGDLAAMITWLRYHDSPSSQVQEMMQKTCKFRAAKIREEKEKTVLQLLDEYPRLVDTDGMVEQDFRQLFPEVCDNLFLKWPKIFKKIIAYANKQVHWKQLL